MKSFTQQEPIPQAGIEAAIEVMRSGRLHRYNLLPGELGPVGLLEQTYADWQGSTYCLALASGGQAMSIALRALGVGPGDTVLTNAFTLAPVPGAIAAVGAKPLLVEITEDLVLDFADLERKIAANRPAALMLSNMRGHLCDMDRLARICREADLPLIEDCAHTMGARWKGERSGSFGAFGCFSTQTYKHLNSGEGGLLTSDDPELMARAIILSGSYMLFDRHGAAPQREAFSDIRLDTPNMSARMDALRAAILLPQLEAIEDAIARWNTRHDALASGLGQLPGVALPRRPAAESYVGSSVQFRLPGANVQTMRAIVAAAAELGVELKWFGNEDPVGFTSAHRSWRYAGRQDLPRTDEVLSTLLDIRVPLTFDLDDCAHIVAVIGHVLQREVIAA
ncbi:DegT/DnrJ/EryC1/StrS family aminotransferase [Pontivivens insulae]|nr:DegT/DnrJ/EryC1/StrS family aminotransferase [Pontivivens insulae]